MKKTIVLAYLALFISFLMPVLRADKPWERLLPSSGAPVAAARETQKPEPQAAEASPAAEIQTQTQPAPAAAETIRVLLADGQAREMDMQDYLTGVVAAEMPAAFEPEALKAQAVAARTFALYCAQGHKHTTADVCTDFACCQAWQSQEEQEAKWGENYDRYATKIRAAIQETAGEYLSFEGKPVFAAFHASSAGATEASGEIWNPVPYLVSVSSPETAQTVPNYVSSVDCAALDFRDVILSGHPEADFTGEESQWIGEVSRDESGRVKTAVLGDVALSGTELRKLFSLRSTAFDLSYSNGRFLFTVTGNGHGVGMSQYGAQVMAQEGAGYTEILAHYYPGTTLVI